MQELKLYRHDFKMREDGGKLVKYDFFQVIGKEVPEAYPSVANAAYWKEQNASKLLPPRTRQHVNY